MYFDAMHDFYIPLRFAHSTTTVGGERGCGDVTAAYLMLRRNLMIAFSGCGGGTMMLIWAMLDSRHEVFWATLFEDLWQQLKQVLLGRFRA